MERKYRNNSKYLEGGFIHPFTKSIRKFAKNIWTDKIEFYVDCVRINFYR